MKEKNVFISHHGKDDEHINNLRELLKRKGYNLKNSSIDSSKPNEANNPDYIKSILRPRIDWAGTMIVLIGSGTATREYVNWEINYAGPDKNIVGVYIRGASGADVPEAFNEYGRALVGWNSDKIIDAINGKITDWENPDGTPRQSHYEIPRDSC